MTGDSASVDLKSVIESILFVADGPVETAVLARTAGAEEDEVRSVLDALAADYAARGLRIQRSAAAAQLVTAPGVTPYIQRFLGVDENQRLSPTVLAALTIIAYKQPITRAQIEKLLGKSCDWAVASLKARELITEVGRAPGPGRPYLLGTTFRFLEHFGLEKPEDLPPLPELESARSTGDEPQAPAEPGETAG